MKFNVEVARIAYGFKTITVEAKDEFEAADKALEVAGDHVFNEKTSKYEVDLVEEAA